MFQTTNQTSFGNMLEIIEYNWLDGVLTILKNMKVNGKDDIPYMTWKIKAMFQTTNQITLL